MIVDAQYGVLEVVLADTRAADGAGTPLRTESLAVPSGHDPEDAAGEGHAAEPSGSQTTHPEASLNRASVSPLSQHQQSVDVIIGCRMSVLATALLQTGLGKQPAGHVGVNTRKGSMATSAGWSSDMDRLCCLWL